MSDSVEMRRACYQVSIDGRLEQTGSIMSSEAELIASTAAPELSF